uniref:Uncharacterized protein n=1 Tax=Rhodnius prolixus TaxID=13249 RepID=T1IAW2_RHOPR
MILYVRAAALAVTVVVAVSTYLWTRAHSNRAHRERPLNVAPRFLFHQNDPRAEQSGNFSRFVYFQYHLVLKFVLLSKMAILSFVRYTYSHVIFINNNYCILNSNQSQSNRKPKY